MNSATGDLMGTMTQPERELHARMNAAIRDALNGLLADFDITARDLGKEGRDELDCLRGDLKAALLKAYAHNHEVG